MSIFLVHNTCGTKFAQYVGGDFCPDAELRSADYIYVDGQKPQPGSVMWCHKCRRGVGNRIHHEIDPEDWRF